MPQTAGQVPTIDLTRTESVHPSRPAQLAVLGGTPTFEEPIHVGRPNLGDKSVFMTLIGDMYDRKWLTNSGPFVERFENEVARHIGVRNCVATCNATVALELAARALDMKGEVIVPSWTFVATAHALQWQEITPVFCDVDAETHTIDPTKASELITPRTTGILGVNIWGQPCQIDDLETLARTHKLRLVFDSAHGFGCTFNETYLGNFGSAEVLSFHATKFLNCGEGGAVVTNDDELAARLRGMRNFGFRGLDDVRHLGTNGKMSELSAVMGLANLQSLDEFARANTANRAAYAEGLAGIPGVSLMSYAASHTNNHQYVVVEIDKESAALDRDALLEVLWAENVRARRYFFPGCHRMEPYSSFAAIAALQLTVTEMLCDRTLVLPTGSSISKEQVALICTIVHSAMSRPSAVRDALKGKRYYSVDTSPDAPRRGPYHA